MDRYGGRSEQTKLKRVRFDFNKMKQEAMHEDDHVRKRVFLEYYERFAEFPTYLFDERSGIDPRLQKTIEDIRNDSSMTPAVLKGIEALVLRLQL